MQVFVKNDKTTPSILVPQIFLVDYGEFVNVPLSDIRYLRKCVAHELRLQAIWCGIHNILPQERWEERIIDAGYEMIGHASSPFMVKFMNSILFNVCSFQ